MAHSVLTENEARLEEAASSNAGARAPGTFKAVLVGVDGSSTGRDAIALGDALRAPEGRLILAHVVLARVPVHRTLHSTSVGRNSRAMLERERAAAGVSASLTAMFAPSVRSGLDQLADDCNADLLVVGASRRRTVRRLLARTDTPRSQRSSDRPVAVAPSAYAEQRGPIKTIGVAYDASPESQRALAEARHLAGRMDAAVHTMTVVSEAITDAATRRRTVVNPALTGAAIRGFTSLGPALTAAAWSAASGRGRRTVLDRLERVAEGQLRPLRGVEAHLVVGSPIDELLAFRDQVDLLIVGSRSHGPLRRLLRRSTSARLAQSAGCPVLVVLRGRAALGASGEQ